LLPAASLANVGVTMNARVLEHAIRKMLSNPLAEVRQLGEEIKRVAQAEVPTLVKYADRVDYLVSSELTLAAEAAPAGALREEERDWCQLVHSDLDGELRAMAAALFRHSGLTYTQAMEQVRGLDEAGRRRLAFTLLGSVGKFDNPLRELEHTSFTAEVILDQGAYAELKRHRMMTQTPQTLSTRLGYAVPRAVTAAGFEPAYRQAMEKACQVYEQIAAAFPAVASYVVPNAFNRRVLMTFNLRSADHFIELRSAPQAHFSIRRIAQRLNEQIKAAAPYLGAHLRVNPRETWQDIEQRYFSQV
jgi:thymidylate synthase ThyX